MFSVEERIEGLDKISPALLNTQKQIKLAVKDGKNPNFQSKYTTLLSVWEACKDALQANELSVVQYGINTDQGWALITRVIHSSGQSIEGALPLVCARANDPQALGSAITYTRRYGLAAMLGICPDDDDANSAMPAKEQPKTFARGIMENREKIKEWNSMTPEERRKAQDAITK